MITKTTSQEPNEADLPVPVDHPDSLYWKHHDGSLNRFPNNGTRAEWQKIADASYARAAHLPED